MVFSHIYFIRDHAKCKFALKFIRFITIPDLFPLDDKNVNIANLVYFEKTPIRKVVEPKNIAGFVGIINGNY